MASRLSRPGVLIAVFALLASACGSSATPAPTAGAPSAAAPSAAESAPAESADASAGAEPSVAAPTPLPADTSQVNPGDVVIRWFCCLGTGDAPEQVAVEQQVADAFNKANPGIHLSFEGYPYQGAVDALSTQIGGGNAPDIVGPVGIGGSEAFHGQWLDLTSLIQKNNYDTSRFPQLSVDFFKAGGEGQLGIPFAIYPSALFYKAGLFKEAGLAEPPHQWNADYTMPDGTKKPWNYDTVREVAKILTVDKNGKDATEAGFDPDNIVQWGFEPQRDDLRQVGAYWTPGSFDSGDHKTVQIPDGWANAWKYFYSGIWTDHVSMTGPTFLNTDINPNNYPFFTGKVAMSENYLWSTYGVSDAGDDWNLAATPAYNGKTTAAFNADTFRIMKSSKHPDEAFKALTYLLGEGAPTLLKAYTAMPAVPGQQDEFFKTLQGDYTQPVDWSVIREGAKYADVPNYENWVPAYNQTFALMNTFSTKWQATPGLNMDQEIADFKSQLQAIWDKGGN
jgi:multiple sugar transport system substrate-binding protein